MIREPLRSGSRRRWLRARPYAVRKPKEYWAMQPGDLVQVDTLDVRPLPGLVWKHFTGRVVVSRWDVVQAHTRATAATATEFLESAATAHAFPIRAVQVDGGSEFAAEFEQACQQRGLRLFVLPPRSPQTQRGGGTGSTHSYRGVLPGDRLLVGDGGPQSRTPGLGENLQHRAPSPVARLPHTTAIPLAVAFRTKGLNVSPIYWTSSNHCVAEKERVRCARQGANQKVGEENLMKKLARVVLLVSACAGLAVAQTQVPTSKAPGVSQTIKQLEHDWVDAAKAGDSNRLSQLLADDWTGIGYDGSKETKQSLLADMKSGASKLESFEFGPMDVKVLGNVAVVQGSDTEKSTANRKDTSGKWVWMDVFVKRDGKWLAVRSQSAMVK